MKKNNSSLISLEKLITKKKDGIDFTEIDFSFFLTKISNKSYPVEIGSIFTLLDVKKIEIEEFFTLFGALRNDVKKISFINDLKFNKPIIDYFEFDELIYSSELLIAPLCVGLGFDYVSLHTKNKYFLETIVTQLDSIAVSTFLGKESKLNSIIEDCGMLIVNCTNQLVPYFKDYLNFLVLTQAENCLLYLVIFLLSKFIIPQTFLLINLKVGVDQLIKTVAIAKKISSVLLQLATKYEHKIIIFVTNDMSLISKYYGITIGIKKVNDFLNGNPIFNELSLQLKKMFIEIGIRTKIGSDKNKLEDKYDELIATKKALNIFHRFAAKQKGANLIRHTNFKINKFFNPKFQQNIKAKQSGYFKFKDFSALKKILYELKCFTISDTDKVDQQAGIIFHKMEGDTVNEGEIIATLYSSSKISEKILKWFDSNIVLLQEKKELSLKPYILCVFDNIDGLNDAKNKKTK